MNGITIYTHGSSPASAKAAERLEQLGISVVDTPSSAVTHLLLPVPSFDKNGTLRGGGTLSALLDTLPGGITVIGGNLPEQELVGYNIMDLLKDPFYLAENAAITADCAVNLARQSLPIVWDQCPVLIIGWGRIGKCLAQLLKAMGADVTVAVRKAQDMAMLRGLGYGAENIGKIHYGLVRYRVIFNTVPVPVLSEAQTGHCREDCLFVELASVPGIDAEKVVSAGGLPGKLAPESSGKLIARTVVRLLLGRDY